VAKDHRVNEQSIWRQRFAESLARAATRAADARRDSRRIACAFTANVDRVATLDAVLIERLYEGRIVANRPRVTSAETVEDLLAGIAQCIAAGDGTDLPISEAVQDWLLARMNGRLQIGGTGAQAAATLATLGFPTLLHLTGYSPQQIAVLPHRESMAVGMPDGLLTIEAAVRPDDPTMWHPALEFAAGLPAPLAGRPLAPAPNRVLIHYDPVNAAFGIDPGFAAAMADPGIAIGALLISGFSQVEGDATRAALLREVAAAARAWRAARPGLFVHLELGAMPDFSAVAGIVAALQPVVTSIGMNVDELRELLVVHGVTMAAPGPALMTQLRDLAARYPVSRFSVHTREYCLTLTNGDPAREQDALLFGSLVAATRCRIGTFPTLADLEETLVSSPVNAEGLAFLRALGVSDAAQEGGIVATPGLAVEAAASVGLGDSFTGGVLAMM
jgi:ADP-dependent phosphofructokinase/glucokinase